MKVECFTYNLKLLHHGYVEVFNGGSIPNTKAHLSTGGLSEVVPFHTPNSEWSPEPMDYYGNTNKMVLCKQSGHIPEKTSVGDDCIFFYWVEEKTFYNKSLIKIGPLSMSNYLFDNGLKNYSKSSLPGILESLSKNNPYEYLSNVLEIMVIGDLISQEEEKAIIKNVKWDLDFLNQSNPVAELVKQNVPQLKWVLKKGVVEFPKAVPALETPPPPVDPKPLGYAVFDYISAKPVNTAVNGLKTKPAAKMEQEKLKAAGVPHPNPTPKGPPKKKGMFIGNVKVNYLTNPTQVWYTAGDFFDDEVV